jgi:hypothetical protein
VSARTFSRPPSAHQDLSCDRHAICVDELGPGEDRVAIDLGCYFLDFHGDESGPREDATQGLKRFDN